MEQESRHEEQAPEEPQEKREVILRTLQRTGSQTLVMVTHDPHLAALADRRIHLEQLSQVGAP